MGIFLGILAFFGFGILWNGFLRLENDEIIEQTHRIRNRVQGEVKFIATKLGDWAAWDDMYDYAKSKSKVFEKANLAPYDSIANLGQDLLVVLDRKHNVIRALQNDPVQHIPVPLNSNFERQFEHTSAFSKTFLTNTDPAKYSSGIMKVDGQVWLLAARPITTTNKFGEYRGFLILGRQVTRELISEWALDLEMSIDTFQVDKIPNFKANELPNREPILTRVQDSRQVNSITWFEDFQGKPSFAIQGFFTREIVAHGSTTIWTIAGIVSLATLLITVVIMYSLEHVVIKRVSRLRRDSQRIANTHDNSVRLTVTGNDEIASLGESINKMVDMINERTAQIREIMQNAKFGLFITDSNGIILRGHTRSCNDLIGLGITGLHAGKALQFAGENLEFFKMVFEQLNEDFIPAEVTLNQLPKRVFCAGKTISISASPVRDQSGKVARVLFSLIDATIQVETERENEENKTLLSVLKARTGFHSLIRQLKSELNDIQAELSEPEQLNARMRLHTFNGNFRSFGLHHLSEIVSTTEAKSMISVADIKKIETNTRAWVAKYETILGVRWDQSSGRETHEVSDAALTQLENSVNASESVGEEAKGFIHSFAKYARAKPLFELLVPATTLAKDLSLRLGKNATLLIQGGDIRVNPAHVQHLLDAIPHLIRNALDHGIELPSERLVLQKAAEATIYITVESLTSNVLRLTFNDDGRGIDPDKIGDIAIKKGLTSRDKVDQMNPREKMELILLPGFTSQFEVTEVSGRGIGMSAVKTIIEENLRGEFKIDSIRGQGTTITMTIPIESVELTKFGDKLAAA
jgi:two-component system chemotaxis sensor kinase CheA